MRNIIFTFLFLLIPLNFSYALCNSEELNLYERYKDQFKITPEFDYDKEMYTLYFYNPLPNSFYYYNYNFDNMNCFSQNEFEKKCSFFDVGEYYFYLLGNSDSCKDIIDEKYISLSLNKYYKDPLCDGLSDFVLCNPIYEKDISYDEFVNRVNLYKESKKNEEKEYIGDDVPPVSRDNSFLTFFSMILEFIKTNILYILLVIISIIILSIIIINIVNSHRKKWRLE